MLRLAVFAAAILSAGLAHSETIDQAIAAAVARDPDLAAANAERDAAQARLEQARAASSPTVTLSGTIGVGRLDPQGFFGISADDVVPRAAQLTAEVPLYAGGRLSAGRVQARAGVVIGNAALAARQRQLELDVVSAYADVYSARKSRDAALRSAQDMNETERQADLLFQAGESARTEYLQAQSRRSEAEAAAAQAEGELQSAIARFTALTGLPAAAIETAPALPAGPPTRDEAVRSAIAGNPAVVEAEAAVAAAEAARKAARAERAPRIAAFVEGSTVRDQFFPNYKADAVTVGVRGSWRLFDGLQTSSKVQEADAKFRAAQDRSRSVRRDIEVRTVVAWESREATKAKRAAVDRQRSAAEAALRDVRLEFKAGAKPLLAVLDAERDALTADAAVARSEGESARAAWQLYILTR